jgi:hypothetical protein
MAKKVKTKEEKEEALRKILSPFAQWIYGDTEIAKAVIDKYFKQKPL